MEIPLTLLREVVERAVREDLAWGDVTTDAVVPPGIQATATAVGRQPGVLAGLAAFSMAFQVVDSATTVQPALADGAPLAAGCQIATIQGSAASLLKAERVALNFLQRLSGVATLASHYVQAVAGLPVQIVDTRKTTPGLRALEKYATVIGGARNHRHNLSDGILIKDNHLVALRAIGGSLGDAVARARAGASHIMRVEVEADTLEQVQEAVEAGADIILLDNMDQETMRRAVALVRGRALTEASGEVTLATVRAVAETGVDLISIGALTHSARAIDISLEFHPSA